MFGCRTLSDIDEVVADILVGEFAFPGTVYQTLSIIYCLKSSSVYVSVCACERACARACVCVRACVCWNECKFSSPKLLVYKHETWND